MAWWRMGGGGARAVLCCAHQPLPVLCCAVLCCAVLLCRTVLRCMSWAHHALAPPLCFGPALITRVLGLSGFVIPCALAPPSSPVISPPLCCAVPCCALLQELDRHAEALPSLRDALHWLDPDESDVPRARLHYAIAQSAIATHVPNLLRSSLIRAQQCGQVSSSFQLSVFLSAHT